jgi:CheY-like chemotaxis protein
VRGRVLVIDDVVEIAQLIPIALPEHDVTVATRATDAISRFASGETYDVILCDLTMPELGGQEVLERLEAEWPHLASAMIFMTGGPMTEESRQFLEQSSLRVLTKPFSIDQLRTTILRHLQDRRRECN